MVFNSGDLVWLHPRKERFPSWRQQTHGSRRRPFQGFKSIRDNAYKLELPGDIHVSATFNVGDLAAYVKDDFKDLNANPSQEGEANAYQAPSQLLSTPSSIPKSKPAFLNQHGHRSRISSEFDLASHHPTKVQLELSMLHLEA